MSPRPTKTHQPGLHEAIEVARLHHQLVELLHNATVRAIADRQAAVKSALKLGATLRDLAQMFGVSPETVRTMADERPAWQRHQRRLQRESRYRAGYEHGFAGGPATDNPYGNHPDGAGWNDGWRMGSGAYRVEVLASQLVVDLDRATRQAATATTG